MDWQALIDSTEGLMSSQECEELSRWAKKAHNGVALEVGHYTGLSTIVLLESLPEHLPFVTVDWRRWRPAAGEVFEKHVPEFVNGRDFHVLVQHSSFAIGRIEDPISFVLYDADHTVAGNRYFWDAVAHRLADNCILIFDDADWEGQSTLENLAIEDGFVKQDTRPLHRHVVPEDGRNWHELLDIGKRHPDTFTLEVMVRESI